MRWMITSDTGTADATELVQTARWSGDYQQAARRLELSILSTPKDESIPTINCPLGSRVQMVTGDQILFDGFVISRSKNTDGNTLGLTCFDRGFYLKRNKAMYKFTDVPPEAITAQIAGDFNIQVGHLEPTGINLTRLFLGGNDSLYDMIATVYTLAAKSTGKKYHIGFEGPALTVRTIGPGPKTVFVKGGVNLIAAQTSESIEQLVSSVMIYSPTGDFVREVRDDTRLRQFGRLQEILKQTQKDDKALAAQKILDDNDVSQKMTVDNLGDINSITGGTVVVQESYTGLFGLFYIISDTHDWKRGQYYNKLVIDFNAMMDEKEAGSLPGSGAGSSSGGSAMEWQYDYYGNDRG